MNKENQLDCCIVKDLLPNYIEGLTCETTNAQIEEHLSVCPPCNGSYNYMKARMELGQSMPGRKDEKGRKFFKKVRSKRILAWILAVFTGLCLFVLGLSQFNAYRIIPDEYVHLQNIYEMADGRIVCAFMVDGLKPGQGWINTNYIIPLSESELRIGIEFGYNLRAKLLNKSYNEPFYYILDAQKIREDEMPLYPKMKDAEKVDIVLELKDSSCIWWEEREDVTKLNETQSKELLQTITQSRGYEGYDRIMSIENSLVTPAPIVTPMPEYLKEAQQTLIPEALATLAPRLPDE